MAEKQDIPMNAFKLLTDAAYIYGEAGDSSQGKMKKSDLLNMMFQIRKDISGSLDNETKSGVYGLSLAAYPDSDSPVFYGTLLVFDGYGLAISSNPIIQVAVSHDCSLLKIRAKWLSSWSEWKSISIT